MAFHNGSLWRTSENFVGRSPLKRWEIVSNFSNSTKSCTILHNCAQPRAGQSWTWRPLIALARPHERTQFGFVSQNPNPGTAGPCPAVPRATRTNPIWLRFAKSQSRYRWAMPGGPPRDTTKPNWLRFANFRRRAWPSATRPRFYDKLKAESATYQRSRSQLLP